MTSQVKTLYGNKQDTFLSSSEYDEEAGRPTTSDTKPPEGNKFDAGCVGGLVLVRDGEFCGARVGEPSGGITCVRGLG